MQHGVLCDPRLVSILQSPSHDDAQPIYNDDFMPFSLGLNSGLAVSDYQGPSSGWGAVALPAETSYGDSENLQTSFTASPDYLFTQINSSKQLKNATKNYVATPNPSDSSKDAGLTQLYYETPVQNLNYLTRYEATKLEQVHGRILKLSSYLHCSSFLLIFLDFHSI